MLSLLPSHRYVVDLLYFNEGGILSLSFITKLSIIILYVRFVRYYKLAFSKESFSSINEINF